MTRSSPSRGRRAGMRTPSHGLARMSRLRTAERITPDISRRHCTSVAGASRAPRSVIQRCTAMWSIFDSGQLPHCASTWLRMIEASRAVVVASVFHVRIQSRA